MVIGITGDQEKEKLRKFFGDNYSFKFVDVDEIFSDVLKNMLKEDEKIRIEIYRLYVILKMIVDCELKKYGKFDWMYKKFRY